MSKQCAKQEEAQGHTLNINYILPKQLSMNVHKSIRYFKMVTFPTRKTVIDTTIVARLAWK